MLNATLIFLIMNYWSMYTYTQSSLKCVCVDGNFSTRPREGKLWNFGGTDKKHKRFLTGSTGISWVGKEGRDNVGMVHVHLF